MSFFDDYVADGLCCQSCGAFLGGDEPGFARFCDACAREMARAEKAKRHPPKTGFGRSRIIRKGKP